jgi:hypothetical protein
MKVEFCEEHLDGSATYAVELTKEETDIVISYGLRKILEQTAKELEKSDDAK